MPIEKVYQVTKGKTFQLAEQPTAIDLKLSKGEMKETIEKNIQELQSHQEKLYARGQKGVLILFQAMDAAGKDSMIKHVMSGINPQGCTVTSFKQPSTLELDHDFMWRIHQAVPRRGDIGIFNRSYYEDVLITRVHPEILLNERLPGIKTLDDIKEKFYTHRYKTIKQFESYLTREGFVVLKFFLHLSKEEQKNRFIRRIELPEKNWKFSEADMKERGYWDDYQQAYEKAIQATATKANPWYIIPADDKWTSRLIVSQIINQRLADMDLAFPTVSAEKKEALEKSLKELTKQ
ncbi:polyphosphate kinase 2 family protein [Enterococcus camelliae]|uniref:Polyphosphate kinase 2 family protein n=1 Tax=Enterococcus camelliae TaxID=453959 RepID=A0ABW5TGH0_9ENTE